MATGGGGAGGDGNPMLGGAALGVGFGMANMFQQNAPGAATPGAQPNQSPGQLKGGAKAPDGADQVTCPGCGKVVSARKFCAECGKPLPLGPKFCKECGYQLGSDTKFCPECGNKA